MVFRKYLNSGINIEKLHALCEVFLFCKWGKYLPLFIISKQNYENDISIFSLMRDEFFIRTGSGRP